MSEFTVSLSKLVSDGQLEIGAGRPRSVDLDGFGLPILRVADVLDGKIESSFPDAPRAYREEMGPKVSKPGDIVLTAKGTVGRVAMVRSDGPLFAYSPQLCYFRPSEDGVLDPRFFYYWFKSAEFWNQADALKGQTDMADFLSLGDVFSLKVRVPSRVEQKGVADVLGALDGKIAVNERITTSADELLRVLYQEVSGRASDVISVGKIGTLVREGVSASSLVGDEHYIGLEHMPRRNMWLTAWEKSAELASAKSKFNLGDVLFGKLRPYFHKVGIALTSGVCSTDILVVRPTEPRRLGWLLLALSSDEVVAHASAVGDGTRMPRAKWKDLETFNVPWPGDEQVTRMNEVVRSMAARIQSTVAENRTLATLRDTLLPQLMSGRLRVKDAEKIVEDAT